MADDYLSLKLSLKAHPMELLRPYFETKGYIHCRRLTETPDQSVVLLAGLVLIRQRPSSAKGVIFITIEDETGVANLIVWPNKMERYRRMVFGSQILGAVGKLQREGIVTHIVVERLFDYSYKLGELASTNYSTSDTIESFKHPINTTKVIIPRSRYFK